MEWTERAVACARFLEREIVTENRHWIHNGFQLRQKIFTGGHSKDYKPAGSLAHHNRYNMVGQ